MIVNYCKLVYKVYYNKEVTHGETFHQKNIGEEDVSILIMKQVTLNAETRRKSCVKKNCPTSHELRHTFYAPYFVFNLHSNFNDCIFFFYMTRLKPY